MSRTRTEINTCWNVVALRVVFLRPFLTFSALFLVVVDRLDFPSRGERNGVICLQLGHLQSVKCILGLFRFANEEAFRI